MQARPKGREVVRLVTLLDQARLAAGAAADAVLERQRSGNFELRMPGIPQWFVDRSS
ncbi:MAG: hypothetical protein ACRDL8_02805 [Solirubrobacteraceae bacterium]